MGTYRMYTDSDGKARWEDIDLAQTPEWLEGIDTTNIRFAYRQPGGPASWHPAPRRQFVFIVSGQLEIGFEDGTTKVFGPGDARLVEDTIGKGHTTLVLGDEPCLIASISLKDQ